MLLPLASRIAAKQHLSSDLQNFQLLDQILATGFNGISRTVFQFVNLRLWKLHCNVTGQIRQEMNI